VGAVPPAVNQRAEWAVIASILLHGDARFVRKLITLGMCSRGSDFYYDRNAALFVAAVRIAECNGRIDAITLCAEQDCDPPWTQGEIEELATHVPVAAHFAEYAKIIVELALWRRDWKTVLDLRAAFIARDREAWERAYGPTAQPMPSAELVDVPRLRLVKADPSTGEIIESLSCENCQKLQDELAGANRDLRGWAVRHANLKRDKEAEARADGMWQTAQRLFEYWKRKTGHTRSPFTSTRFYECVPYLREPKYGPEKVERAIVGLVHDPWVTIRRNGTRNNHDNWDRLFKSSDGFEEWCRCAPLDWKSELNLAVPSEPLESVPEIIVQVAG
jgi:DnaB-like helicase N terminal domain